VARGIVNDDTSRIRRNLCTGAEIPWTCLLFTPLSTLRLACVSTGVRDTTPAEQL
jgi:hypothetical protein